MSGLVVAFVDDNGATRRWAHRALTDAAPDVDILEGESGLDAITLRFGTPAPDLLIVNGYMPGINGQEAVRIIREREARDSLRRVPILFESGDSSCVEEGLAAGADAALPLPFSRGELVTAVRSMTAARP